MRRHLPLIALAACATSSAEVQPPQPAPTRIELRQRPATSPFDGKVFASQQVTPAECERAARQLKLTSPDDAWQALVGCVQRQRWTRGEFTQLDLFTSGAWDEELQTRPEAPGVIARVIALRGGDVEGDLEAVQRRRLPVFTLAAAMKQPGVYKGRYVLLRGQLEDLKGDGPATTAMLHETSLRATAHEQDIGARYHYAGSSRYTGSGTVSNSRTGTTSAAGTLSSSHSAEAYATRMKYENDKVVTGRVALGRLPQADPFLEPQKDFLFLTRFDGMRAAPVTEDNPVAVLTIINYYKPNALVVE